MSTMITAADLHRDAATFGYTQVGDEEVTLTCDDGSMHTFAFEELTESRQDLLREARATAKVTGSVSATMIVTRQGYGILARWIRPETPAPAPRRFGKRRTFPAGAAS